MFKKLFEVFTKEYKNETEMLELKKRMMSLIKLKCAEIESIDDKVDRLKQIGYDSCFETGVEQFDEAKRHLLEKKN